MPLPLELRTPEVFLTRVDVEDEGRPASSAGPWLSSA